MAITRRRSTSSSENTARDPEPCGGPVGRNRRVDIQNRTGAEAFTGIFSYGGMPYDLAEANLRLFTAEVMPILKRRVPVEDQLIARAGVGQSAAAGAFRLPV